MYNENVKSLQINLEILQKNVKKLKTLKKRDFSKKQEEIDGQISIL